MTSSMISLILLVFAFVLAVLAGSLNPAPAPPWPWRLLCYSLACWFLADLVVRGGTLLH